MSFLPLIMIFFMIAALGVVVIGVIAMAAVPAGLMMLCSKMIS